MERIEVLFTAEVDTVVAEHAASARSLGLEPLVHMRTPWNPAGILVKHRTDPLLVAALDGVYFIEILVDHAWLKEDKRSRYWTNALICGTYANSFNRVTADGAAERVSRQIRPRHTGKDRRDAAQLSGADRVRVHRALRVPPVRSLTLLQRERLGLATCVSRPAGPGGGRKVGFCRIQKDNQKNMR